MNPTPQKSGLTAAKMQSAFQALCNIKPQGNFVAQAYAGTYGWVNLGTGPGSPYDLTLMENRTNPTIMEIPGIPVVIHLVSKERGHTYFALKPGTDAIKQGVAIYTTTPVWAFMPHDIDGLSDTAVPDNMKPRQLLNSRGYAKYLNLTEPQFAKLIEFCENHAKMLA